jgi:hypothetical protein
MNKANIRLKNTPEQIELIKAMASPNAETANKAREAFAAFIGPVINQVLNLMGTANQIYVDWPYNEDDLPMFPLDQYYGTQVDHVQVWSQNMAGGLGTSLVTGLQEMALSTYRLDTAVALLEKNVRRGRLPYVSLALNRMAQDLLLKSETNKWLVAIKALAEAKTAGLQHLIQSTVADVLQLDDFNRLITLSKRLNVAFDGAGTPEAAYSRGATDLFMSPECMEDIRGFAYQPMNTRSVINTDESTAVPLPDAVREEIYRNAGASEIYGMTLHELNELGIAKKYNNLFDASYDNTVTFDTANQEIVIGVDKSRDALIRPIAQNADNGATLTVQQDDQWPKRSGKIGFFGAMEEGACVIDSRALVGCIIQ